MRRKIIEWHPNPAAEGWEQTEPDGVVWVDVTKLDAAWQRTEQYVLPGGANGQGSRYERVEQWFEENCYSNMFFAVICDDGIEFGEGRHRFAWLRDRGVEAIQLQVPSDQEHHFIFQFGTELRESVLMA
ncbi:MAG: hypothetical protein IPN84_16625 [Sphingomonadales bacterium]|nr:hypothetical protein [Sphingomonadales bacterium]